MYYAGVLGCIKMYTKTYIYRQGSSGWAMPLRYYGVIHLECIHVYKAFPIWTEANQSDPASLCQIYQFTGRLQTGKYWDISC